MQEIVIDGEICLADSEQEAFDAIAAKSPHYRIAILDPRAEQMVNQCSPAKMVLYGNAPKPAQGLFACVSEEVVDGEVVSHVDFKFHQVSLGSCLPTMEYLNVKNVGTHEIGRIIGDDDDDSLDDDEDYGPDEPPDWDEDWDDDDDDDEDENDNDD